MEVENQCNKEWIICGDKFSARSNPVKRGSGNNSILFVIEFAVSADLPAITILERNIIMKGLNCETGLKKWCKQSCRHLSGTD